MATAPVTPAQPMSALIIDPNRQMRTLLREFLRPYGLLDVREAENAADGLKSFLSAPPTILFLEYDLAPINGNEFTTFVRNNRDSPAQKVPIVMVTGHAEQGVVLGARKAGINAILVKPVSADALRNHLQGFLKHTVEDVRSGKAPRASAALPPSKIQAVVSRLGFAPGQSEKHLVQDSNRSLSDEALADLFGGPG